MGLSRKSLYYLLKQDKLNHALNSYKRSYPNNKVREIAYICQVAREVPKKKIRKRIKLSKNKQQFISMDLIDDLENLKVKVFTLVSLLNFMHMSVPYERLEIQYL